MSQLISKLARLLGFSEIRRRPPVQSSFSRFVPNLESLEARLVPAATITWQGGAMGNPNAWDVPANWVGNVVPNLAPATDDVVIPKTNFNNRCEVPVGLGVAAHNLTIEKGGWLEDNGSLLVTASLTVDGNLAISDTMLVSKSVTDNGSIIVSAGASLTAGKDVTVGSNAVGHLTLEAGSVTARQVVLGRGGFLSVGYPTDFQFPASGTITGNVENAGVITFQTQTTLNAQTQGGSLTINGEYVGKPDNVVKTNVYYWADQNTTVDEGDKIIASRVNLSGSAQGGLGTLVVKSVGVGNPLTTTYPIFVSVGPVRLMNGDFAKKDIALPNYIGENKGFRYSIKPRLGGAALSLPSDTSIASSANPISAGTVVTFTANVAPDTSITPGAPTPTGTVDFFDQNGTLIGSGLLSNGIAALSTNNLAAGMDNVTAFYEGDANYSCSSAATDEEVDALSSTIGLTANHNPSVHGQPVTCTASVAGPSSNNPIPTGTIAFYAHGNWIGEGILDNTGTATYTTHLGDLPIGNATITAVYNGDSAYYGSQANLEQTINLVTGTLPSLAVLTSSQSPADAGQQITLTATVTDPSGDPNDPTPTGIVDLYDENNAWIGSGTLNSNGIVTFTTSGLAIGMDILTAVYEGDNAYAGSVAADTQEIDALPSSTTVTSDCPNWAVYGQPVTFTAVVADSSGDPNNPMPTGTVDFYADGNWLGDGQLDSTGTATYTSQFGDLPVGTSTITASYDGNAIYDVSSAALTQTVYQAATTLSLVSSPSTSNYSDSVTFTATVTPVAPGNGIPTGTVTFVDENYNILGTAVLDDTGTAVFSTSALPAGTHTITAHYGQDSNFTCSLDSVTQTVFQAATTTTLSTSASTANYGDSITFTAGVTSSVGIPTGTVTFTDENSNVLGTVTLDGAGNAVLLTSALAVGNHTVTATYSGDTNFQGGVSSGVGETIQDGSAITLMPSTCMPTYGLSSSLAATVAGIDGGPIPAGTVQFYEGPPALGVLLGTATLDNTGTATLDTTTLAVGPHTITAVYTSSDGIFFGTTSNPFSTTIQDGSAITLTPSTATPTYGLTSSLAATVAGIDGGPIPAGTVQFYEGPPALGVLLGTATLDNTGTATLDTTTLAVGPHTITAVYTSTDGVFFGTTSNPFSTTIQDGSAITLTPSTTTPTYGLTSSLAATVAGIDGGPIPAGTVQFYEGPPALGVLLGTATLDNTGTATLDTTTLAVGPHTITAVYISSDGIFFSSSSSIDLTVQKAGATLYDSYAYGAGYTPGDPTYDVNFTVQLVPQPGFLPSDIPSGTVTISDSNVVYGVMTLDANGQGSLTLTLTGPHMLKLEYSGDSLFNDNYVFELVGMSA